MDQPNDQPRRQARRVFQGVRFDVEQLDIRTRDGGTARREVVSHPGSVVVLGVLEDERVLLIRNHRFAVNQTLWELPAGTLEQGEDPAACARRELTEETGYEPRQVHWLCSFYTTPGICNEYMHVYKAVNLHHVGQNLDEGERIKVHPLGMERVLEMIRDHEIIDAKTLAVLLYFDRINTT